MQPVELSSLKLVTLTSATHTFRASNIPVTLKEEIGTLLTHFDPDSKFALQIIENSCTVSKKNSSLCYFDFTATFSGLPKWRQLINLSVSNITCKVWVFHHPISDCEKINAGYFVGLSAIGNNVVNRNEILNILKKITNVQNNSNFLLSPIKIDDKIIVWSLATNSKAVLTDILIYFKQKSCPTLSNGKKLIYFTKPGEIIPFMNKTQNKKYWKIMKASVSSPSFTLLAFDINDLSSEQLASHVQKYVSPVNIDIRYDKPKNNNNNNNVRPSKRYAVITLSSPEDLRTLSLATIDNIHFKIPYSQSFNDSDLESTPSVTFSDTDNSENESHISTFNSNDLHHFNNIISNNNNSSPTPSTFSTPTSVSSSIIRDLQDQINSLNNTIQKKELEIADLKDSLAEISLQNQLAVEEQIDLQTKHHTDLLNMLSTIVPDKFIIIDEETKQDTLPNAPKTKIKTIISPYKTRLRESKIRREQITNQLSEIKKSKEKRSNI